MKKRILWASGLLLAAISLFLTTQCRAIRVQSDARPISHSSWDALLKKHVSAAGWVDYRGFISDSLALNAYLDLLRSSHPSDQTWSREEQMAYWINAYNAFTVKLVADHYPVASIKDIRPGLPFVNTVWDIKFINIQGHVYDLNNIEHNILRPVFKDPRIHAAVNCASYSCPRLSTEAFVPERLHEQLDAAMRQFVNDPLRNPISAQSTTLSEIFKWFAGDFSDQAGSVRDFINRYAATPIPAEASLNYLDYDWRLNDLTHASGK